MGRGSHNAVIQVLLVLLQLLAMGAFALVTIICTVLAIWRWRKKQPYYILAGVAVLTALLAVGVASVDLTGGETTDREDSVEAFHQNFGFYPPDDVKEIMVKNYTMRDASSHWMAFTYVPRVYETIVENDQPLQTVYANTPDFNTIMHDAYLRNANTPDWTSSPKGRTGKILFKKGFLSHSFSEYYLWVDTTAAMVHLHVSYFD